MATGLDHTAGIARPQAFGQMGKIRDTPMRIARLMILAPYDSTDWKNGLSSEAMNPSDPTTMVTPPSQNMPTQASSRLSHPSGYPEVAMMEPRAAAATSITASHRRR